MKKVIYVTGCLGFIGSTLTKKLLDLGHYVVGVDKKTYAANQDYLEVLLKYKNFKYQEIDIIDMDSIIECDVIVNTAAETHVDNSIIGTNKFLKSNVLGVENLLNLVLTKRHFKFPVFIQFSTDEVYGDIRDGSHTEDDLLRPSNPYSASKAAADMLVLAWARTYKIPFVIVRPTNNYGVRQYTEKFIPKVCKNLLLENKIPLHEGGTPIRTWLHVEDTADAIICIIEKNITNEIFNISGNIELQNKLVAEKIIDIFFEYSVQNKEHYFDYTYSRQGQDVRYSINDNKLKSLGWNNKKSFDKELINIVSYYKNNFVW